MSAQPTLLFIDDDPKAGELMQRFSEGAAHRCRVFDNAESALDHFRLHGAELIITDLRMPGMSGMELLAEVRRDDPDVPVIIVTGYSSVDSAIEALRLGATDFIKKPFDMEELLILVEKTLERHRLRLENRLLKRQLGDARARYGMIGDSPAMRRVYGLIEKVADIRCSVIVEGESGTGKELAARAIHNLGQDADQPFIVIDCGALTDTLLESELFGHERGAFTGAAHTKRGLLEAAAGGTVFLDEIGNVSVAMQTKLLRVVQEQQITRVGGVRPIDIDARFIVATNRNLETMVREGRFRHDLYHRLNVVKIAMPPLRERREDIPLLLAHFVRELAERYRREVSGFEPRAIQALRDYEWPGNVRELRNLVERHVALAEGPVLRLERPDGASAVPADGTIDADLPSLEELERRYILKVLEHFGGSRERTAQALGINKSTLWRRLQQYRPSADRRDARRGPHG